MKVEAPRDTHLCGAWRCRAEKLQQQPQHWQSLHPNVATLHLQHRVYHVYHVYHVSRVPAPPSPAV